MFCKSAFTTDPLTRLISKLKSSGIWDSIVWLSVLRATETASLVNIKNSTEIATNHSMTFSAGGGFVGGTSKYIDTGKSMNVSPITTTSQHMWAYWNIEDSMGAASTQIGVSGTTIISEIYTLEIATDLVRGRLTNNTTGTPASISSENFKGFAGVTKTASNVGTLNCNGTTNTQTSMGDTSILENYSVYVGAHNAAGVASTYSNARITGWGFGSGLSVADLEKLRTYVQEYMTSIGVSV